MVTIRSLAFTSAARMEQERCTSSLMCTEQAPHWAIPQPYLVPVRPTCSRMTHRSGVSASTSTSRMLPLMLSFAMDVLASRSCASIRSSCRGRGRKDQHEIAGMLRATIPDRRLLHHACVGQVTAKRGEPTALKLFAGWHLRYQPAALSWTQLWQRSCPKARAVRSGRAHPGVLEKIGHLAARIEHPRLHSRGRNTDDFRNLVDRLLMVVNEIDDLPVRRRKLGEALLHD